MLSQGAEWGSLDGGQLAGVHYRARELVDRTGQEREFGCHSSEHIVMRRSVRRNNQELLENCRPSARPPTPHPPQARGAA